MPCVERSDRQTCLEGSTSGRPQEEIDSRMPNLRYAHDTHRRIYMYYAAGRKPCSPISENSTTERPVKTPNIDVLPFVPCQNRVKTLCVGAAGVNFERKADSPTY